mmetsp:Transcript_7154/g.20210  ORF Transcript_7154/g.20210 Transcript_7154/m.20210 type:complete len:219 (-) Transcript_7154:56-712(-)
MANGLLYGRPVELLPGRLCHFNLVELLLHGGEVLGRLLQACGVLGSQLLVVQRVLLVLAGLLLSLVHPVDVVLHLTLHSHCSLCCGVHLLVGVLNCPGGTVLSFADLVNCLLQGLPQCVPFLPQLSLEFTLTDDQPFLVEPRNHESNQETHRRADKHAAVVFVIPEPVAGVVEAYAGGRKEAIHGAISLPVDRRVYLRSARHDHQQPLLEGTIDRKQT